MDEERLIMDITFLPMKAVFLIICILGAVIGTIYFGKGYRLFGALIGTATTLLLLAILMAVVPVKLTTNTKAYTATQTQAAYARHKDIPEKVEVEVTTFEEMQENERLRSIRANQQLQESLK